MGAYNQLLEFYFFELNVLANLWVVLFLNELVFLSLAILGRDIKVAGACGRFEFDELAIAFRHDILFQRMIAYSLQRPEPLTRSDRGITC